jgi:two-component system sensor histidine kinase VanS
MSLLVEDAVETLLPLADKRGVTIHASGEAASALGSPALLLQLVTNLVHNAIVHSGPEKDPEKDPEKGPAKRIVWVATSVRRRSVVLTVENTGEVLSPRLVSTLTEPFRRGTERVHSDHAGVGLGLAIVKSITEAHDGTLTLAPRAAGGLCVTVRLARPGQQVMGKSKYVSGYGSSSRV